MCLKTCQITAPMPGSPGATGKWPWGGFLGSVILTWGGQVCERIRSTKTVLNNNNNNDKSHLCLSTCYFVCQAPSKGITCILSVTLCCTHGAFFPFYRKTIKLRLLPQVSNIQLSSSPCKDRAPAQSPVIHLKAKEITAIFWGHWRTVVYREILQLKLYLCCTWTKQTREKMWPAGQRA